MISLFTFLFTSEDDNASFSRSKSMSETSQPMAWQIIDILSHEAMNYLNYLSCFHSSDHK